MRPMIERNMMAETQTDVKERILLVDDDPLIVESLGFMLRKHFDVIVADSRQSASNCNVSGNG